MRNVFKQIHEKPAILGEPAIPLHPPDNRNTSREKLALRAPNAEQGFDLNKA